MPVDCQKEGRIAIFTINRPEKLNSIDLPTFQELHDRMIEFRDDPELWVGIVTGARTRAFSIGADIKELLPLAQENRDKPWLFPDSIMRGLEIWKPIIAAVNGMALGGGLEIALACDIRIASDKAVFGMLEVTHGLIPGWGGTQRLPRTIPPCLAAEMIFTGKTITAEEAYRIGLVNRVVPRDEVLNAAREVAEAICQAGPLAVRAAKESMVRGYSLPLDKGLELENRLEAAVLGTEDFSEGIAAFAERRKPSFRGK